MRRTLALAAAILAVAALTFAPHHALAQEAPAPRATPTPIPLPRTPDAITHHAVTIGGTRIAYTARAGRITLRDAQNSPNASMFYTAFTKDGAPLGKRPVTFFWNGGPGSSTIYLRMGSFAPMRVLVPSDGSQPRPDAPLIDNPQSLLDVSDLVFVDAVGTGWSTIVGHGKGADFWGIDEDAKAFAQFIERYEAAFGRGVSPTFLFGESYGTTRAANVANVLEGDGVAVRGVVLQSSALDYNVLPVGAGPGEDLSSIGYLPTEAAVAWYHHKVPNRPASLERFMADARSFAGGEYARALRMGDKLDPNERRHIIDRLHAFTGLDAHYIENADLRIDPNRFSSQLLRAEGLSVGRYDGRYVLPEPDRNTTNPTYDASDTNVNAAFVMNWTHYAHDVLGYHEERAYNVLDIGVNQAWKYQRGQDSSAPNVLGDLRDAMNQNPYMHVFSANGYYDLATSFYGTEDGLQHLGLNAQGRARLHYGFYPSGHMIYLNNAALITFKKDLTTFYADALR
jgi:carboxypeptidase C (cathepsin A)